MESVHFCLQRHWSLEFHLIAIDYCWTLMQLSNQLSAVWQFLPARLSYVDSFGKGGDHPFHFSQWVNHLEVHQLTYRFCRCFGLQRTGSEGQGLEMHGKAVGIDTQLHTLGMFDLKPVNCSLIHIYWTSFTRCILGCPDVLIDRLASCNQKKLQTMQ